MPEQLRWDISLLGLAGLLALIVWIADLPWLIEADEPTIRGSRPPAARQGDVLLLLPDAPAGSADTFGELDCTFGWYNTLWQYFGAFATALERNLSPSLLEDRRLVVVPDRVADGMPENGVQALAEFAESGGQVLLVQPGDRWSEVAGVSPSSKTRPAESITSARGLGLSGRLRRALPEVPLAGQLTPVPATPPWPEGHSLLTVDKRPGLTVREVGAGAVYTAQFEIGCTVTALQQGRPDSGMSFGDQTDDRLLPTAERIAAPSMATARAPYADLLERAVLHRATELRPTPRIWSQPAHRAGSLLVVHPAPASPRAAFAFVDHARSHDSPTTVFAAADRWHERRGALADRAGTDVGLLWVRGSSRPKVTQRYRLGGLTLVEREQSLDRQLAQLADGAAAFDPRRVARVEGAEHHARWSRTVRQLGAAGVRVDVSYGPHGDEQFGYLFGTGYPFYPVDRRGLPVPVAELPYVLHGPSLSIERLETFLRQSRRSYHQTLTVSVASTAMRRHPSDSLLPAVARFYELARTHDHWIATVPDFTRFASARFDSTITSSWDPQAGRLKATVTVPDAPILRTGDDPPTIGVALPAASPGGRLASVEIDGSHRPASELRATGPGYERVVPLDPGEHRLIATYEPIESAR